MNIEITDLDMILNSLETTSLEPHDDYTSEFTYKEQKELYNYIKNLQKENKELNDRWNKLKELFDIQKDSEYYDALQWLQYQTVNYENKSINIHYYRILYNLVLNLQQKQKKFIKFLEDNWKETQDIWYIKVLNKYKEIIRDEKE